MNKILAMIDGSIYSSSICEHTAWVAIRLGSAVELMHIIGRQGVGSDPANLSGNIGLGARTSLLEELSEHDAQTARLAQQRGRIILDDAAEKLADAGVNEVTTRMRNSEMVESVLSSEASVDLIVIGKRGEGADFDKLHPGSNLERVVRSCTKPVLVASRAYTPIGRLLVAFDGGSSCLKAVDHISQNTLFTGLPVKLLTVGERTTAAISSLEEATAVLAEAGYSVTNEILPGVPEAVISDDIGGQEHTLLVMGAYGHSRIRNLIIGSTTTAMITSCRVPVLLFR